MKRTFLGYVLRTDKGHDLDGYVFRDWAHAVEWMAQPWASAEGYRVHAATFYRTRCCRKAHGFRFGAQVLP